MSKKKEKGERKMDRKVIIADAKEIIESEIAVLESVDIVKRFVIEVPFILDFDEVERLNESTFGQDWKIAFRPKLDLKKKTQSTILTIKRTKK